MIHFFKAIFHTSFRPSRLFFGKWDSMICINGKRHSGTKCTSPAFCVPFAKLRTDRFAHVNGQLPKSSMKKDHVFLLCYDFVLKSLSSCLSRFIDTHIINFFVAYSNATKGLRPRNTRSN